MALAHVWYEATISLVDNGGNTTTKRYRLRAATIVDAVTDTATILAALEAVTNSVVSGYRVSDVFAESAFAYPAAGVENEDKASLACLLTTAGGKKANLKIPAPVIGIFTAATGPGANVVDAADAALITYTDIFKAAGEAFISDGEDLDSVLSGKRISAKSNSG